VQNLTKDLQLEFPGVAGFSAPNLYKMRQFYEAYRENQNLSPLVREISWTKNLAILERCNGNEERDQNWQRLASYAELGIMQRVLSRVPFCEKAADLHVARGHPA
jgi:hypothetical protein